MVQQLLVQNDSQKGELTQPQIDNLVQAGIVPKDTPKAQILIFAQVCSEKNLSPFSKEIYLLGYGNKYSIITGIDGFRSIAARTGELAGCDDAKFDLQPNGAYCTAAQLAANNKLPTTCTITIYRVVAGVRCPFTHTAVFKEFSSSQQKWASMPFQMIAKVAESFALRKAFADATSGIHIEEERAAIEENTTIPNAPEAVLTESDLNLLHDIEVELTAMDTLEKLSEYGKLKKVFLTEKGASQEVINKFVALGIARKTQLVKPSK
jgi:phage recombination protein Bet